MGGAAFRAWQTERANGAANASALFSESIENFAELAERQEPDAFSPHYMLSSAYFFAGDMHSSARELQKIITILGQGNHGLLLHSQTFVMCMHIACALGDATGAKAVMDLFQKAYPETYAQELVAGFSNGVKGIYVVSDQNRNTPAEIKKRASIVKSLFAAIPPDRVDRRMLDHARFRHAIQLFIASRGDKALAESMIDGAAPEAIAASGDECSHYIAKVVAPEMFMLDRSDTDLAEKSVEFMERLLPADSRRPLLHAYVVLALLEYNRGEEEKGNRYIREAFVANKGEAEWMFKNYAGLSFKPAVTSADVLRILAKDPQKDDDELNCVWKKRAVMPPRERAQLSKMFKRLAVGFEAAGDNRDKTAMLNAAAAI